MAQKPMTTQQRFAVQSNYEKQVAKLYPTITRKSGIYLFFRVNEKGEHCAYVGQAQNLLQRIAGHLSVRAKKTHIDKSLEKHKLCSTENPEGWKVAVLELCDKSLLDIREQAYIDHYKNRKDIKLYNVTGGGQLDKKEDVGERFEVKLKSYKNGKNFAYEKARLQVKTYFDKYLDFSIKPPTNKIKERKFAEFQEFLKGKEDIEETE